MTRDRRLGRGLAALLGTPAEEPVAPPVESRHPTPSAPTPSDTGFELTQGPPSEEAPDPATVDEAIEMELDDEGDRISDVFHLNVYEIDDNPFQPRREFSETEIASLSESLKEHDMLQPVLVRRVDDRYQLISGERRLRAAIQAGWSTVPARIRDADDRLVAELAIVENLQRKDLNPIEKAMSFKRYVDEHRCTQDDLARRLKIDRSTIANLMRLLELPGEVLDCVQSGSISAGHARALLPLGEESEQVDFCGRIRKDGWSVRETERQVTGALEVAEDEAVISMSGARSKRKRTQSSHIASLEQELRIALGTKVEIRQSSRGRGKIIVTFANNDEFERLREHLTAHPGLPKGDTA